MKAVLVLLIALSASPAAAPDVDATATARAESPQRTLPCKASLVPWNCANLFSGSFEWQSTLTGGKGTVINIQESVTLR